MIRYEGKGKCYLVEPGEGKVEKEVFDKVRERDCRG